MIRQRSKSTILKRCRKFSANREAPGYRLHHRQPGVSYSAIPSFLILAILSSMCLPSFSGSLSRSFFREHCDGKVPVMNELKAEKEKLLTLQSEQRKELSAMLLSMTQFLTEIQTVSIRELIVRNDQVSALRSKKISKNLVCSFVHISIRISEGGSVPSEKIISLDIISDTGVILELSGTRVSAHILCR